MKKILFIFLLSLECFFFTKSLYSQPQLEIEAFATGLFQAVDIAHAGDGRLFIVEKNGRIRIVDQDGNLKNAPFLDIRSKVRSSSNTQDERGLLGLVFHPDFANNGYFYVNYIQLNGNTMVARFTVSDTDPDLANPSSETTILSQTQPFSNHNGGDLNFGPDGFLYLAFGDGGSGGDPGNRSQNKETFHGKLLRIDVNNGDPYAVPSDNPFVNDANILDEIYALGLRNPWRFSFDRETGDIWIGDVGQGTFEEICFLPSASMGGENFGWRCYEGSVPFNTSANCPDVSDLTAPLFEYPTTISVGRSVTGGYVYRGTQYPLLVGHYLFGDYKSGRFWTLSRNEQEEWVEKDHGLLLGSNSISTFGEDLNGELYVTDYSDGVIYKIKETSTTSLNPSYFQPILIYPNPMRASAKLTFPNRTGGVSELVIYDLNGREVRRISDISTDYLRLERQNLISGMYIVELKGDLIFRAKLWVQ